MARPKIKSYSCYFYKLYSFLLKAYTVNVVTNLSRDITGIRCRWRNLFNKLKCSKTKTLVCKIWTDPTVIGHFETPDLTRFKKKIFDGFVIFV